MTHTKWPWVADESLNIVADGGRVICSAGGWSGWGNPKKDREINIANAHLIAAAPDMLEALKNLENDDGLTMPKSAWDLVVAAIAKAEGKK